MKFYVMILITLSISCRRRDKADDLYESIQSGFLSGIANGLMKNCDKVVTPLKNSAETVAGMFQFVRNGLKLRADHIMLNAKYGIDVGYKINSGSCIKDTMKWLKDNPIAMNRLKLDQAGISAAGKLVGNAGTKIISALPFISAAYNGYEAIYRLSDEDYFGAGLKLANAVITLLPGVSFAQSIIPSAASVIYDIFK